MRLCVLWTLQCCISPSRSNSSFPPCVEPPLPAKMSPISPHNPSLSVSSKPSAGAGSQLCRAELVHSIHLETSQQQDNQSRQLAGSVTGMVSFTQLQHALIFTNLITKRVFMGETQLRLDNGAKLCSRGTEVHRHTDRVIA